MRHQAWYLDRWGICLRLHVSAWGRRFSCAQQQSHDRGAGHALGGCPVKETRWRTLGIARGELLWRNIVLFYLRHVEHSRRHHACACSRQLFFRSEVVNYDAKAYLR